MLGGPYAPRLDVFPEILRDHLPGERSAPRPTGLCRGQLRCASDGRALTEAGEQRLYRAQFDVVSRRGHTVDTSPASSDTAIVKCEADGPFSGVRSCQAVSRGTTSAASLNETSFGGSVSSTCEPGYSTDGARPGAIPYVKAYLVSSAWGKVTPGECSDIDYCSTSPCGALKLEIDDAEM